MENFLNTTLRNVAWFKQAHERKELEMKPPFQRNPVWVTRQKSYLIDTILNKYPIPEIYMQEVTDENGNVRYIIIDGQQRIRSIIDFMSGNFPLDEKESPEFNGAYFDDLTPEQKKEFFKYNFVVRVLPDINEVELRAIFQRLNKNVVALNKQELRQATYSGTFIRLMNSISDKEVFGKIGLFTPNDVRRMLDVEYLSELTIAFLNGQQNKKDKLDTYYQIYEESFDEEGLVKDTYDSVLGEIIKILPDISQTRWSKKTDFYTLFSVFASHKDKLPLSKDKRSEAGVKLREFGNSINDRIKVKASDEDKSYSSSVNGYVSGMRATTDLSSRRARFKALDEELDGIWE